MSNHCPIIDIIYNELCEYDIITITESHLDQSIKDTDIELEGFIHQSNLIATGMEMVLYFM